MHGRIPGHRIWWPLTLLILSLPASAQDLIVNGSFESGIVPWSGAGTVSTDQAHHGTHSLRYGPGDVQAEQVVTVEPGEAYKLSAWVYLDPSFTGSDWGGVLLSAVHWDWSGNYQSEFISPANRPVGAWFQEVLTFTPSVGTLRIQVGFFGGGGWSPHFHLDQIALRPLSGDNQPPYFESVSVNATSGTAPFAFTASVVASDDDGAVTLIRHELGDGAIRTGASIAHVYALDGTYLWRVSAFDDQGASVSDSLWIVVDQPGAPGIFITSPSSEDTWSTEADTVTLQGTRSGGTGAVLWRNERTDQGAEVTAGPTFATGPIALARGANPIRVQTRTADGSYRTDLIAVERVVPGMTGPALYGLMTDPLEVGTNTPWECRFDVETVATNPSIPYDPAPPPFLEAETGISVDAIFTRGDLELVQPVWLAMQYERDGSRLRATGELRWTVRMAFTVPGHYEVRLRARDASGTSELSGPTVHVSPSSHVGYLRVAEADDRYFEYEDGTQFFPLGHSTSIGDAASTDAELALWRANGLNFTRLWLSSRSPFSDAWSSWATHHAMPDNGYLPPSLRTSEESSEGGDFSWKLAAPAIPNVQTPAMFRGFWDGPTAARPNTTYRISARVKTRDVAGEGLVLKTGGWLGEAVTQPGVGVKRSASARGTSPWFYLSGDYTTAGTETTLPNLYLALEAATGGTAYCDRMVVQEVRTDGSLAANILAKPDADAHLRLDPTRSIDFDHWARAASSSGIHAKVVILEKNDWLLNQFDAYGRIDPRHASFDPASDSKLHRLYSYYWRHLLARYGAETSIHSWELVNEGAPGSYPGLTDAFADFFHTQGPRPRMASTSFWCCWVPGYWASSAADYGDLHAYAMTTGWIDTITIDGETYDREALKEDPAALVYAYSITVGGDPGRTRPVILSETDLDQPGDQSPDPRLAGDTLGLWLHDFNWAHLNHGGVPALIWNPSNIRENGLHHQFRSLRAFVRDLGLNSGGYVPAQAATSHPRLRAWGQRRADGTAVHLWIENRDHTWARVLESGPPAPVDGLVTLTGLSAGPMRLEVWSTQDTLPASTQTIQVPPDGSYTFPVEDLVWDLALKLASGASEVATEPEPPRTPFRVAVSPHPSLGRVQVALSLPTAGPVRLDLFTVTGRRVRTLHDGLLPAGDQKLSWDGILQSGNDAPAGIYFLRARWRDQSQSKQIVLLRR